MKKLIVFISLLVCTVLVTGCAPNISPYPYNGMDVGVANTVKKGVVISKHPVSVNNNSGIGGLAGTATGAAAGSMIGGNGATGLIGAIGGALIGGLAGDAIDSDVNRHFGFEYIVRLNNGRTISVVQVDDMPFRLHQRVLVIYGRITRLVPDTIRA